MICNKCQEGHILVDVAVYYVTHDMALDAECPEMEGMIYDEVPVWGMCGCCEGKFESCERCKEESKEVEE